MPLIRAAFERIVRATPALPAMDWLALVHQHLIVQRHFCDRPVNARDLGFRAWVPSGAVS
jgi:hypothetical protein